jgi:hypothetical protein
MAHDGPHRTRAEYERGLPGYHDPTSGIGGSAPARGALTFRAVLAVFGIVVSAAGAAVALQVGVTWLAVFLAVLAVIALIDLGWIVHRKRRGEPG